MCYTVFVAKTRVRPTAIPATSHPLGHHKKSRKSNHCHTSENSSRNSFPCHTYKNKGLKGPLFATHFSNQREYPCNG